MNDRSCRRTWLKQTISLSVLTTGSVGLRLDASHGCAAQEPHPSDDSWDLPTLAKSEPLIEAAIAEGQMPGCVVGIGCRATMPWLKAYGERQVEPTREAMTVDTIFDLASLTKPIATATSLMLLWQQGAIDLDASVARYLPEFAAQGKSEITIEDLLVHRSGLIPDNPMSDYRHGIDEAWERIWQLKPTSQRGARFQYSDVNFLVLGKLIERVSGKTLDEFAKRNLFAPLKMSDTGYCPAKNLQPRIAPTEMQNGIWLKGVVHDPRAAALGGVAGHAGLFSTASDLALFCQAMLRCSQVTTEDAEATQPFAYSTYQRMNRPIAINKDIRALGWDKASGYSANGGSRRSATAFGHGGFTGTGLWIDPEQDWFFIFLSNRLHPDGHGAVNSLAGQIATLAVSARRRA